jgi:solute carrier family 25 uncoupling protein 27
MRGCHRAALVNLGDLTTYDSVKQIVRKTSLGDTSTTHAVSSLCAGLVAATMGYACLLATMANRDRAPHRTPADVIKTRVMNQPVKDGR